MWAESKDTSSNTLQRLWLHICDAELYAYFTNLCKEDEVENHLKCTVLQFKWMELHIHGQLML